jgi:uncharacterized membrane protein (GlpM family)
MQLIFRFLVGGIVVSIFATLGDLVKPKSFGGLLSAAPSVALATLGLIVLAEGRDYAAQESRSMIAGAMAFFLYSCLCMRLLAKHARGATLVTVSSLALWLACALGIWFAVLR